MKPLLNVFRREAYLVSHDFDLVVMLGVVPLVYGFFYGSVYVHKGERNIALAVVDNSGSARSRALSRALDAHPMLAVVDLPDEAAAEVALVAGDIQATLVIPKDYAAKLASGQRAQLGLLLNNNRFLTSNDTLRAVSDVVGTLGAELRTRRLEARGLPTAQAAKRTEPLTAVLKPLFNATETYGDFIIFGVLALILQQTLLVGVAEAMARERETKSLGALMQAANTSPLTAVVGKSLFYLALFAAYTLFVMVVPFAVFHLPMRGAWSALVPLFGLHFVAIIGLSLFLSSFFSRKLSALVLFIATSYPLFLASGYSWPLSAMPAPMRALVLLLPTTHFFAAYTRIANMGASLDQVVPEMLALLGMAVVGIGLAVWRLHTLTRGSRVADALAVVSV